MDSSKELLVSTSNNALPAIKDATSLAEIRLNKSIPRYKDYQPSGRIGWLKKQLISLYAIKHINLSDANGNSRMQMIETDAAALDGFIMRDAVISDFTLFEISDAFLSGLAGDYGDYIGLASDTLFRFLRAFRDGEKKAEATRIVRERRELEKKREFENRQAAIQAEIQAAKADGSFVPTRRTSFTPKIVDKITEEERAAHREKIREQARMAREGLI